MKQLRASSRHLTPHMTRYVCGQFAIEVEFSPQLIFWNARCGRPFCLPEGHDELEIPTLQDMA